MKIKTAELLLRLSLVGGLASVAGAEDRLGPLEPWLARPGAAILSGALLLEHLGHPEAAAQISTAVEADVAERGMAAGAQPRSTEEVGEAIAARASAAAAEGVAAV